MKLLAISDTYIPLEFMQQGLAALEPLGVQVEVRRWEHATLIQLQEANLAIEQGGPEAVPLPAELTKNLAGFQIVVVQFTPLSRGFIEGASDLKVIGVLRGGTENLDVEYATERGISVLNTPGRNGVVMKSRTWPAVIRSTRLPNAPPINRARPARISHIECGTRLR